METVDLSPQVQGLGELQPGVCGPVSPGVGFGKRSHLADQM